MLLWPEQVVGFTAYHLRFLVKRMSASTACPSPSYQTHARPRTPSGSAPKPTVLKPSPVPLHEASAPICVPRLVRPR